MLGSCSNTNAKRTKAFPDWTGKISKKIRFWRNFWPYAAREVAKIGDFLKKIAKTFSAILAWMELRHRAEIFFASQLDLKLPRSKRVRRKILDPRTRHFWLLKRGSKIWKSVKKSFTNVEVIPLKAREIFSHFSFKLITLVKTKSGVFWRPKTGFPDQ